MFCMPGFSCRANCKSTLASRLFGFLWALLANLSGSTKIFILEMGRLYNWWIGLNPGERSWEIRIPGRDEL